MRRIGRPDHCRSGKAPHLLLSAGTDLSVKTPVGSGGRIVAAKMHAARCARSVFARLAIASLRRRNQVCRCRSCRAVIRRCVVRWFHGCLRVRRRRLLVHESRLVFGHGRLVLGDRRLVLCNRRLLRHGSGLLLRDCGFLRGAAGFASAAAGFVSGAAGFASAAAGLGSMARIRSMNSLHSSGKTTSPETVSPIGLQPPGGGMLPSFAGDAAGTGLGSAGLLVWASAAPLITARRRQHGTPARWAKGIWRVKKRFIGSLNQLRWQCSSTPFRQVYE